MEKITNPLKYIFIILIKTYKYCVSPLLGQHCRFFPNCSSYAEQSLKEYGIFKGIYLIIKRILKCHPLHSGGFDPVPVREHKK
jgi:uncharacterized protein